MIYTFNSAFHLLYRKNVLKTMFLPHGATNEYRYTLPEQVSVGLRGRLTDPKFGVEAAVIFIDRYAQGGYRFIPLRLASFVGTWSDGNRQFFRLALTQFVCPTDLNRFNADLGAVLKAQGLPKLTDCDPDCKKDGCYAIEGESIFADESKFIYDDQGWEQSVQALYKTQAFAKNEVDTPVFSRCRLAESGRPLAARLRQERARIELRPGRTYNAELYYHTSTGARPPATKIALSGDSNARAIGSSVLSVDAESNQLMIPLSIAQRPSYLDGALAILIEQQPGQDAQQADEKLFPLKLDIPYSVKTKSHWILITLLAMFFVFFDALGTFDLTKLPAAATQPATVWWDWLYIVLGYLAPHAFYVRVVAGFIKILSVMGLIKIIGTKPF